MSTITGLEFYRRRQHWSKFELGRQSGIHRDSIAFFEARESLERCRMDKILALADALGVTVDQILEIHTREELGPKDKNFRPSEKHHPENILAIYRKANNYTLSEFGEVLGITQWGASKLCRPPVAKEKYVRKLADMEGMTLEEFYDNYRTNKEETE